MNNLYQKSKNAVDKVFFHFWKKIIKRYANNSFSRIWVFLFDIVMVLVAFWFSRLVFKTMAIPGRQPLHVLAYLFILVGVYSRFILFLRYEKGADLFFPQYAEIIHEVLMIFFVLVISRLTVRRLFSEYTTPKRGTARKRPWCSERGAEVC